MPSRLARRDGRALAGERGAALYAARSAAPAVDLADVHRDRLRRLRVDVRTDVDRDLDGAGLAEAARDRQALLGADRVAERPGGVRGFAVASRYRDRVR